MFGSFAAVAGAIHLDEGGDMETQESWMNHPFWADKKDHCVLRYKKALCRQINKQLADPGADLQALPLPDRCVQPAGEACSDVWGFTSLLLICCAATAAAACATLLWPVCGQGRRAGCCTYYHWAVKHPAPCHGLVYLQLWHLTGAEAKDDMVLPHQPVSTWQHF